MLRPAHRLGFLRRQHQRMRCEPDQEADDQSIEQVLDVPVVSFGSRHPRHPLPEIVIGADE